MNHSLNKFFFFHFDSTSTLALEKQTFVHYQYLSSYFESFASRMYSFLVSSKSLQRVRSPTSNFTAVSIPTGNEHLRFFLLVSRFLSICDCCCPAKSLQSCPMLCDPIDGSPPGSPSLGFSRQEHWSGLPFPSPMHESEK